MPLRVRLSDWLGVALDDPGNSVLEVATKAPEQELLNVLRMLGKIALFTAQREVRRFISSALSNWSLMVNMSPSL